MLNLTKQLQRMCLLAALAGGCAWGQMTVFAGAIPQGFLARFFPPNVETYQVWISGADADTQCFSVVVSYAVNGSPAVATQVSLDQYPSGAINAAAVFELPLGAVISNVTVEQLKRSGAPASFTP
jgi:hypothetical protein